MKLGIVGLPNVGKSTLFNALTNAGAASANYPFCTIEPNVGVVAVPDARLDVLAGMYSPKKVTPASIEFVDIAGLVKGASKGEGLGNRFLSHIREVDAVVHVVRCFDSDDIVHVDGGPAPLRDIETIETELILSDLETAERRAERAEKLAKAGGRGPAQQAETLARLCAWMNGGKSARTFEAQGDAEAALIAELPLLSAKPVIFAANLSEDDLLGGIGANPYYPQVQRYAKEQGAGCLPVCAKVEADLAGTPADERAAFLADLGLSSGGLETLIRESYRLLGLISFLTAGEPEVRAWTIRDGTRAPQAAGKIHSDIERGFIRAEVVAYGELVACGGLAAARERGLVRSEGKDYIMRDGDVTLFRFNV